MHSPTPVLLALGLTGLLSACAWPQWAYDSMMQGRKEQCRKLPDRAERQRCEKEADKSYDRYKAEAEAAKRPAP